MKTETETETETLLRQAIANIQVELKKYADVGACVAKLKTEEREALRLLKRLKIMRATREAGKKTKQAGG